LRVMEALTRRAKEAETRRLPIIPVILLMPETIDDDTKNNLLSIGCYDIIINLPTTTRDLFAAVLDLLYRRSLVENAYNDLRTQQRNIKYPHLQVFEDEKLSAHAVESDEDESDGSASSEGDDNEAAIENTAIFDCEVDDKAYPQDIHPRRIAELRATYMKTIKRKTGSVDMKGSAGNLGKNSELKERQLLDRHIMKSILVDTLELRDGGSESDDDM
jgi:hypothetical protein